MGEGYYGYTNEQLRRFTDITVRENNDRLRIFKPQAIPAYVELLCSLQAWKGDLAVARKRSLAIRTLGPPISPSARESLGSSKRVDLGETFVASLTGLGRTNPKLAAEALSYWPCHVVSNLMRLNMCLSDRSLAYVRVDTRVCCDAAAPKAQTFIEVSKVEMFPLPGCKNWRCSCSFDRGSIYDPLLESIPDGLSTQIVLKDD
jgi:hypothetical protein